jgi:crotonobetainyl-CoA:carnitine CoA-transferase CaiB-like acyl-CoA transferase
LASPEGHEIHDDPQTKATGFVQVARHADGREAALASPGVLFGGDAGEPRAGPDWKKHTDEVLFELGLTKEDISSYRESGVIK